MKNSQDISKPPPSFFSISCTWVLLVDLPFLLMGNFGLNMKLDGKSKYREKAKGNILITYIPS